MKRQMPFYFMVLFAFLGGVTLCLVLLNLTCGVLLQPVMVRDTKARMEKYEVILEECHENGTDEEVDMLLSELYDGCLIRASIIDKEGIVQHTTDVFSRKRSIDVMEELIDRFEEHQEDPYFVEYQNSDKDPLTIYCIHKQASGGYIFMNRSIRGIEQNVQIVSWFLLMAGVMSALVGTIVWMVATRPFSRSMEQMSSVTHRIAQLDFSQRVNYKGRIQEIVVLAESIDDLSVRLEASLKEMNQELERRKELLRNLAHEIKTPLTTIRGYTENMEIVTAGNARAARYCQIMLEECTALDVLAAEMMEVSTLEGSEDFYELRLLDIGALFASIRRRILREMPEKQIDIRAEQASIVGNPYLLERVVFNYLGNADRYRIPNTPILVEGHQIGDRYRISVTNEGEPIPKEEQDRIWDAFYKVDKSRKRSGSYGVGLSIVRQIAAMHNGEVGVTCQDGKTAFFLELRTDAVKKEG